MEKSDPPRLFWGEFLLLARCQHPPTRPPEVRRRCLSASNAVCGPDPQQGPPRAPAVSLAQRRGESSRRAFEFYTTHPVRFLRRP